MPTTSSIGINVSIFITLLTIFTHAGGESLEVADGKNWRTEQEQVIFVTT